MKTGIISSCLSLLFCWVAASGQSGTGRVGGLSYDLPPGWSQETRGNSVVLRPDDASRARICMVVITDGLPIRGSFESWVESQWTIARGTRREVFRQDLPVTKDSSGMEALAITAVLQIGNTPKQYHLFTGFRLGESGSIFSFVTDGEDYLSKYEGPVKAIAASIKSLRNIDAQPAAVPPNLPAPPSDTRQPEKQKARTDESGDLPLKLPEPLSMPGGSEEAAAAVLARKVLAGGDESLPALMRAVLSAGHPIVKPDGTALYQPENRRSNGIGCLDAELYLAAASLRKGVSISWQGLSKQAHHNRHAQDFDFAGIWKTDLEGLRRSADPASRFWANFVNAIGSESKGQFSDISSASGESRITSVQAYLILLRSFGALYVARQTSNGSGQLRDEGQLPSLLGDLVLYQGGPSIFDAGIAAVQNYPFFRLDLNRATAHFVGETSYRNLLRVFQDLLNRYPYMSEQGANTWLVALTQWLWTLNYLTAEIDRAPLVRTQIIAQRGKRQEVTYFVKLEIPPEVRRFFESTARELGTDIRLPPDGNISTENGPFRFTPVLPDASAAELVEIIDSGIYERDRGLPGNPAFILFEGVPQQKYLRLNPVADPKTVNVEVRISAAPPRSPGTGEWERMIAALNTRAKFAFELDVIDWRDAGWSGQINASITGSGSYRSRDGETTAEWRTDRSYFVEFSLEGSVPEGLIPGTVRTNPTARGPRKYSTRFSLKEPTVVMRFSDYRRTKGPTLNCILEEEGQAETTVETSLREPKGLMERSSDFSLMDDLRVQRESVEDIYAAQVWKLPPRIPVSELLQSQTTFRGRPEPVVRIPKDKVVSFFQGIKGKGNGPIVLSPAPVERRPDGLVIQGAIQDEGRIDAGVRFDDPQAGRVSIQIYWTFRYAGDQSRGAVFFSIDHALALMAFNDRLRPFLSENPTGDQFDVVEVSSEPVLNAEASCNVVAVRMAGKLRHQNRLNERKKINAGAGTGNRPR